ncbi:MAG: bifunctional phosphoglucose/phosphomannose isomerase [Candidatus Andersenbacteria bacterium]
MAAATREQYRQAIVGFPDQFAGGLEAGERAAAALARRPYERVVLCGMGGSALGAELLNAWLDLAPDLTIHRSYGLPNDVTSKTLLVAVSYSGTTEETLSAVEQAAKDGRPLVAITTGGRLAELGKQHGFPVVPLPTGMPPRLSVGAQFGALYSVLVAAGVVDADAEAVIEAAAEVAQVRDVAGRGKRVADAIGARIPLIYAGDHNAAVARSWKIKCNETGKVQAFWNVLPEADHNEINALPDGGKRFCLVTLDDDQDHPRVRLRLELTAGLAQRNGLAVVRTALEGSSRLSRLLYGVWLGDWVALALADARKADPAGTPIIEDLKARLSR